MKITILREKPSYFYPEVVNEDCDEIEFEKIDECSTDEKNIPLECYELISSKSKSEQEQIYKILIDLEKYRNI